MTPAHDPSTYAKIVGVIKDLPLWIFMAFAVASAILLFVPQINVDLPTDFKPWLILSVVEFGVMSVFKWIELIAGAVHSWRVARKGSKTFHMTPVTQHCWWAVAKQVDGSFVTQIVADFSVKNQSIAPVGLMRARVIKPSISGKVIHDMITVREQRGRMHGTAYVSDYRIAPGTALPARVMVMIVGKPRESETESPRILRRLQPLRRWSHEQEIKQVFTRGPGTRRTAGPRASGGVPLTVGGG
jgi:hypothetical protein